MLLEPHPTRRLSCSLNEFSFFLRGLSVFSAAPGCIEADRAIPDPLSSHAPLSEYIELTVEILEVDMTDARRKPAVGAVKLLLLGDCSPIGLGGVSEVLRSGALCMLLGADGLLSSINLVGIVIALGLRLSPGLGESIRMSKILGRLSSG